MDIIRKQNLKASKTTVWRSIKLLKYVYKNLPNKLKLSLKAKNERIDMSKKFILEGLNWNSVAFSDEKYFTLREADSYYSWIKDGSNP